MEKNIINPSTLARPAGFSHGVLVTGGRLLFLAGQTGSDAEGRIVAVHGRNVAAPGLRVIEIAGPESHLPPRVADLHKHYLEPRTDHSTVRGAPTPRAAVAVVSLTFS